MKRIMQGAALGAIGCAGIVAASAAPASATVTNGGESVNISSPFQVQVENYTTTSPNQSPTNNFNGSDNGFGPSPNQGIISGSGFTPGAPIFLQTCNGVNPSTTGYTVSANCTAANAAQQVSTAGTFSIDTSKISFQFQIFHGVDPGDNHFNCLTTADNPNSGETSSSGYGTTAVGNQPIDPNLQSWGASTVGDSGGGTAPCQLRIGVGPIATTSDIYIPYTGLDASPSPSTQAPESPLTVALPVTAVAVLGVGSVVAVRRRRRRTNAAA